MLTKMRAAFFNGASIVLWYSYTQRLVTLVVLQMRTLHNSVFLCPDKDVPLLQLLINRMIGAAPRAS